MAKNFNTLFEEYVNANGGKVTKAAIEQAFATVLGLTGNFPQKAARVEWWEKQGLSAKEFGSVFLQKAAEATPAQLTVWGEAAADRNAKITAAASETATSLTELQQKLGESDVTAPAGTVYLTVGQDVESGNHFIADVVQNSQGFEANTLGTGDRLTGTGNNAKLEAEIIAAAAIGNREQAIRPATENIKEAQFTALNSGWAGEAGSNTNPINSTVIVDAARMDGVNKYTSQGSNANLVITDVTVLPNQVTENITVKVDHTGNGDSRWSASNFEVYFDQNHLKVAAPSVSGSQAIYWLLDQDAADAGQPPLNRIDRDGVAFELNGTRYEIRPADQAALQAKTHQAYADLLKAEIARLVAEGKTELANLDVKVDLANTRSTYTDKGQLVSVPAIVITDNAGGNFSNLGYTIPPEITGEFNIFGRVSSEAPQVATKDVTLNVELFKAGRGSDGGELIFGGMSKTEANVWNAGSGSKGIQVFNVEVQGDVSKSSSIAGLHSTNNSLERVIIKSAEGSTANLKIGNSKTNVAVNNKAGDGLALKDVQLLDSTAFNGNLTLNNAAITTESIAKYFNLKDQAPSQPGVDNVTFQYLTGSGNDTINLNVSSLVAQREDFKLNINTGAGNDVVNVTIADAGGANWYWNQKGLKNIDINGGSGNNTITTGGWGDATISTGAGNDTIYTDNIGTKAIFALNAAAGLTVNDLGTDYRTGGLTDRQNFDESYNMIRTQVQVTFSTALTGDAARLLNGFESVWVDIPTNNFRVTDLQINQAVKRAINDDAVLSKLIEAVDGPGHTLVINSKIDGLFVAGDLQVNFRADPATVTAAQAKEALAAWGVNTTNLADAAAITQFNDAVNTALLAVRNNGDYNASVLQTGAASTAESNNIVTAGAGNDVVVFGTGANSNDTLKLLAGSMANGKISIVNYDGNAASAGRDYIDFSAVIGGANNQVVMSNVVGANGTLANNSVSTFGVSEADFARLNDSLVTSSLNDANAQNPIAGLLGLNAPVGATAAGNFVLMIENQGNRGEFKVYHLTANAGANEGRFASATEIATLDFGHSNWTGGVVVPPPAGAVVVPFAASAVNTVLNEDAAGGDFVYQITGEPGNFGTADINITNFSAGDVVNLQGVLPNGINQPIPGVNMFDITATANAVEFTVFSGDLADLKTWTVNLALENALDAAVVTAVNNAADFTAAVAELNADLGAGWLLV